MKYVLPLVGLVACTVTLMACGVVPSQAEYDRVDGGKALELPPGLDEPSQRGVVIPEITKPEQPVDEKPVALNQEDEEEGS